MKYFFKIIFPTGLCGTCKINISHRAKRQKKKNCHLRSNELKNVTIKLIKNYIFLRFFFVFALRWSFLYCCWSRALFYFSGGVLLLMLLYVSTYITYNRILFAQTTCLMVLRFVLYHQAKWILCDIFLVSIL